MKLTPDVKKALSDVFTGEELVKVEELWSKKKGNGGWVKDGKLTISKEVLMQKLSVSPKTESKYNLSKLSIKELREVIKEAEALIKTKKDSEIAKLEKEIEEIKSSIS